MPKFKDGDILIVPNGLNVNNSYLHGPFEVHFLKNAPREPTIYNIYPLNDFVYDKHITYNLELSFLWRVDNVDECAILYELPPKSKKTIYNRLSFL